VIVTGYPYIQVSVTEGNNSLMEEAQKNGTSLHTRGYIEVLSL